MKETGGKTKTKKEEENLRYWKGKMMGTIIPNAWIN